MRIIRTISAAIAAFAMTMVTSFAQPSQVKTAVQEYVESIMDSEPMRSAQVGVRAYRLSGEVVADYQSHKKMVPASNVKLLTTGTAMVELGADYRSVTSLAYSGKIEDGILKGDLYIVGGGDPTIASRDSITVSAESLFAKWRAMLSKAGIRRIEGRIVGDGRYFDGDREVSSWLYEDIGTYYGAGSDGLCFYRNIQEFNVTAGTSVGAPLRVSPGYPVLPWMQYSYNCSTGARGTGDMLYLYTTDVAPVAELRGTFAIDRKSKRVQCSNKYGALTCAWMFRENLTANGIKVDGGAADIDSRGMLRTSLSPLETSGKAELQQNLKPLGNTESPVLRRIAYMTNHRSDNFYAESILRTLGKVRKGSADYSRCIEAETDAFLRMNLDVANGVSLVDGSGLSRKNLVTPAFFCDFLRAMMDTPVFGHYVKTLVQPSDRVFYKSGSMDGVRCFSGYVVPSDGGKEDTIVFSIMVNSYTGSSSKIKSQIDRFVELLEKEN